MEAVKAVNNNFHGLTRPGIEPRSTVLVADALCTRPPIGKLEVKEAYSYFSHQFSHQNCISITAFLDRFLIF